ncbi:hypothetical protein GCM10009621_16150 [Corynebacterium felinum]
MRTVWGRIRIAIHMATKPKHTKTAWRTGNAHTLPFSVTDHDIDALVTITTPNAASMNTTIKMLK